MTKRKCGVDEEMEWASGQGGGQNQPAPLCSLRRAAGLPRRRPHLVLTSVMGESTAASIPMLPCVSMACLLINVFVQKIRTN
jgi:hypothetical protein